VTGMTGNRDAARLGWMLILPVTASSGNQIPTISLNQLDDFTDLHRHLAVPFDQGSRDNHCGSHLRVYHYLDESARAIPPTWPITDPMPEPRYRFGVTLFFEDFDAAVEYYRRVLGPPAYVDDEGRALAGDRGRGRYQVRRRRGCLQKSKVWENFGFLSCRPWSIRTLAKFEGNACLPAMNRV
jgi:hypothetical protein